MLKLYLILLHASFAVVMAQNLCAPGFSSPNGMDSPTPCTSCLYTTTNCNVAGSCSPGYYLETKNNQASCKPCLAGNYCPGGREAALGFVATWGVFADWAYGMWSCPINSYCVANSASPTSCPSGKGNKGGATTDTDCKCLPGTYDHGNVGTYDHEGTLSWSMICLVCPGGYYCPGYGGGYLVCPSGSYCPERSDKPLTCGLNSSSPGGSSQCTCNAGFVDSAGTCVRITTTTTTTTSTTSTTTSTTSTTTTPRLRRCRPVKLQ